MQQIAAHNFTLLFIACSTSGLADQNVGKLLDWFQQHWSGLATRHFALVRKGEETGAWPQAITPIIYGPKHDDLAPYIASLVLARSLPTDRPFPPEPNMVGREDAKKALVDKIMNGRRPILILGGPGMGKSTLAVAAAHDATVKARYGNRRVFVNLEPHTTADAMVRACAAALGVSATGALTEILGRLQGGGQQPCLVILDNLETPWHAQQTETEEWIGQLKDVEGLRLVLTHRGGKPSIPGGVEQLDDVKKLEQHEVRALFLRDLPERLATDPDLDALLQELDGHPLSVVLLAAQADGRGTLKSLLADWKDRKADLLRTGAGDTRLLSTRISLAISVDRLDRKSRRLFGLAALLPDGLDEQDIGSVLPGAGTAECMALERMRLVTRDQGRLRMLAPFREVTQVDDRPSRPDERRLINHFLTIAISGRAIGTSSWEGLAHSVDREAENLDEIINRAVGWRDFAPDRIGEAVRGLLEYHAFTGKGGVTSGERVIEQLAFMGEFVLQANCFHGLGDLALRRSNLDGAQGYHEEAMRLYTRVGAERGQANSIRSLGDVALRRSDLDGAQKHYEEAMRLYTKAGGERGRANCIHSLGNVALRRSDLDGAQKHYEEAMRLYTKMGHDLGHAHCIHGLGSLTLRRSDLDGAQKHFEEAMRPYTKVGSEIGQAKRIHSLGGVALHHSDLDGAQKHYEEAMRLYKRVSDEHSHANCIHSLGNVALRRSNLDGAQKHYEEAMRVNKKLGDELGQAHCFRSLGDVALRRSDFDGAQRHYEEAMRLYNKVGSELGQANCVHRFGDLALRRKKGAEAAMHWNAALASYLHLADKPGEGFTCIKLARHGPPEDATKMQEQARVAFKAMQREDFIGRFVDGAEDTDSEF